jgi:hypothetical protein
VATRHDEVLAQPVFVRIAEPTNKLDSLRVLETEHGPVRSGVDVMDGQALRNDSVNSCVRGRRPQGRARSRWTSIVLRDDYGGVAHDVFPPATAAMSARRRRLRRPLVGSEAEWRAWVQNQLHDPAARGVQVHEALRALTTFDVRWACNESGEQLAARLTAPDERSS